MRRLLIAGLLCMLLLAVSQQAGYASSNMEVDLHTEDGTQLHRIAWTIGDQCAYILTDQGIYVYREDDASLRLYAPICGIAGYEDQSKENITLYINNLAFYHGQLYGINTWSGTLIRITENKLPGNSDIVCSFDLNSVFPDSAIPSSAAK